MAWSSPRERDCGDVAIRASRGLAADLADARCCIPLNALEEWPLQARNIPARGPNGVTQEVHERACPTLWISCDVEQDATRLHKLIEVRKSSSRKWSRTVVALTEGSEIRAHDIIGHESAASGQLHAEQQRPGVHRDSDRCGHRPPRFTADRLCRCVHEVAPVAIRTRGLYPEAPLALGTLGQLLHALPAGDLDSSAANRRRGYSERGITRLKPGAKPKVERDLKSEASSV